MTKPLHPSSDDTLFDPPTLPRETERPGLRVRDVLMKDRIPPPKTLLEPSGHTLGTEPIDATRYYSREFFELEKAKLWPKIWHFTCSTYDIPRPGDIYVYRILDKSVLVVRQRDGTLKAFYNSCLHRGSEICSDHAHHAELRCPYHYFTWGLDGRLKWVPTKWDFPQIDEATFNLPEVRLEEWNGFIFVNFDPQAPKLRDFLGRMVTDFESWDFSHKFKAAHFEMTINCNWKTCRDASLESMHVFALHSQGVTLTPDECSQYDVFPDEPHFNRLHVVLGLPSPRLDPQPSPQEVLDTFLAAVCPEALGTPEGRIGPDETARSAMARISRKAVGRQLNYDLSQMPESELLDGTAYSVFPNFAAWPSLANPIVYRFRPTDDPDWCIWETMLYLPFSGERPPQALVIKLGPEGRLDEIESFGLLAPIFQQDAEQLPLVQRGLHSSVSGKLALSRYQEVLIRHYHQTLTKYVNA